MTMTEVFYQLEVLLKLTFITRCSARRALRNTSASSQISADDLLYCCALIKSPLQHTQNVVSKFGIIYAGQGRELPHLETLGSYLQSSREVQASGPLCRTQTHAFSVTVIT